MPPLRSGVLPLSFLLLIAASACWEQPEQGDVIVVDTAPSPCAPADALIPFFVEIVRAKDEDPAAELRLSGLATVLREGPVADDDSPYTRELQLRFVQDPRDIIIRHTTFLDGGDRRSGPPTGFIAAAGESVNAVVWRQAAASGLPTVYVTLRGMDGVSRGFLCRGERCEAPEGLCPAGFDCPRFALQDPDCAALEGHDCGPQFWPPAGIGSAGAAPDLVLYQGEHERVASGSAVWHFFVAYATTWPEAGEHCVDGPAAGIAGGILPEL